LIIAVCLAFIAALAVTYYYLSAALSMTAR
jgi:hypothetical protein